MSGKRLTALMAIMLVSGISLGFGGSTLFWTRMLNRSMLQTDQAIETISKWENVAKQWESNSNQFEKVANECIALRR